MMISFVTMANITHADFLLKDWQFSKRISNPSTSSTYTKVILDSEVYSHSDFKDLRIIDSNNLEIPYKLVEENERNSRTNINATVLDASLSGGQSMAILDTNNSNIVHSSLKLSLQGRSFKKNVLVYASDTRIGHFDSGWRLISSNGYIFNFYDSVTGFVAGNTEISYPKTSSRYLRVVLSGGEGELPIINGGYIVENIINTAKVESSEFPVSIKNNSQEKTTELLADFGVAGVPVNKITLSTSDKNWNRHAVVQVSDSVEGPWRRIGEDYLYSIRQSLYNGENLTISFPEVKNRYLRVVIANYDNAPIDFNSKIQVFRNQRAVIFRSTGMPIKLYYGNMKASTPYYDFDKIFSYADENDISRANLGAEELNPNYEGPIAPEMTFTEKYPQALNVVLVLLVVFLGAVMFFVVKKAKK